MQEHAVVLEREVPLLGDAVESGHAGSELRRAVRLDQGSDALDLLVGRLRVRAANALLPARRERGRCEVDVLELRVHGAADRRPRQALVTDGCDVERAHARDALGEVAVRARLEQ